MKVEWAEKDEIVGSITAAIEAKRVVAGNKYPLVVRLEEMEAGRVFGIVLTASGSVQIDDDEKWLASLESKEKPYAVFKFTAVSAGPGVLKVDILPTNLGVNQMRLDLNVDYAD